MKKRIQDLAESEQTNECLKSPATALLFWNQEAVDSLKLKGSDERRRRRVKEKPSFQNPSSLPRSVEEADKRIEQKAFIQPAAPRETEVKRDSP